MEGLPRPRTPVWNHMQPKEQQQTINEQWIFSRLYSFSGRRALSAFEIFSALLLSKSRVSRVLIYRLEIFLT